jgi:insulysin
LTNDEPNDNDENSAVTFYFQVPSKEIKDYMMIELLAEVLEQPFYDDLRTKQQLGYIVGSGARSREGIKHLTLTVQSSIVDGPELARRIETFIVENFIPALEVSDFFLFCFFPFLIS